MVFTLVNVLLPIASLGVGWLLRHVHASLQVKNAVNESLDAAGQVAANMGKPEIGLAITKLKQ